MSCVQVSFISLCRAYRYHLYHCVVRTGIIYISVSCVQVSFMHASLIIIYSYNTAQVTLSTSPVAPAPATRGLSLPAGSNGAPRSQVTILIVTRSSITLSLYYAPSLCSSPSQAICVKPSLFPPQLPPLCPL